MKNHCTIDNPPLADKNHSCWLYSNHSKTHKSFEENRSSINDVHWSADKKPWPLAIYKFFERKERHSRRTNKKDRAHQHSAPLLNFHAWGRLLRFLYMNYSNLHDNYKPTSQRIPRYRSNHTTGRTTHKHTLNRQNQHEPTAHTRETEQHH